MSDDGTDFITALDQAGEESLDDRAHYRPDRHGQIDLDCFGRGYRRLDPYEQAPIEKRTYPEHGCPRVCTACSVAFVFGEIIHPEIDGTRCIPCWKQKQRNVGRNLAAAFRAAVPPRGVDDPPDHTMTFIAAAFAPPDPDAPDVLETMREGIAALGVPSDFQLRRAAQMFAETPPLTDDEARADVEAGREFLDAMINDTPRGVDAAGVALEMLTVTVAPEDAVAKCSRCGDLNANADAIGAQCARGMLTEPCRGYMHPIGAADLAARYFMP